MSRNTSVTLREHFPVPDDVRRLQIIRRRPLLFLI